MQKCNCKKEYPNTLKGCEICTTDEQNPEQNKICVRCKILKPLGNFPLRKKIPTKQCSSCLETMKKYREQKKTKDSQKKIQDDEKICKQCNKVKHIDNFKNRSTGGKTAKCIDCINYMNAYLDKHKCVHGKKNKSACKECGGASICPHGRSKTYCKECKGGSLCIHKKRKDRCADCIELYGRHQYCEHKCMKTTCIECEGGSICEHGKRRTRCIDCEGGTVCEHKILRNTCRYCDFIGFLTSRVRSRVCSAIKSKSKRTIEYLLCDIETYKKYLEDQFVSGMTWENYGKVWDIDHIVPIKYQNPTIEEVIKRLHYTNTQPLWKEMNMKKGNRFIYKLAATGGCPQEEGETVLPPSPI